MATGARLPPEADRGPPLDRNGVRQCLAEGALRASHVRPVGLELGRHLVDLTEPTRRPAWARVRQALSRAELGCAATATSPTALSLRLAFLRSASALTRPGR